MTEKREDKDSSIYGYSTLSREDFVEIKNQYAYSKSCILLKEAIRVTAGLKLAIPIAWTIAICATTKVPAMFNNRITCWNLLFWTQWNTISKPQLLCALNLQPIFLHLKALQMERCQCHEPNWDRKGWDVTKTSTSITGNTMFNCTQSLASVHLVHFSSGGEWLPHVFYLICWVFAINVLSKWWESFILYLHVFS